MPSIKFKNPEISALQRHIDVFLNQQKENYDEILKFKKTLNKTLNSIYVEEIYKNFKKLSKENNFDFHEAIELIFKDEVIFKDNAIELKDSYLTTLKFKDPEINELQKVAELLVKKQRDNYEEIQSFKRVLNSNLRNSIIIQIKKKINKVAKKLDLNSDEICKQIFKGEVGIEYTDDSNDEPKKENTVYTQITVNDVKYYSMGSNLFNSELKKVGILDINGIAKFD